MIGEFFPWAAGALGIGILCLYRMDSVFEKKFDGSSSTHKIREGVYDYQVRHFAQMRGAGWALIGGGVALLVKAHS